MGPQLMLPMKLPGPLSRLCLLDTEMGLAPLDELPKGTARESLRAAEGLMSMLLERKPFWARGDAPGAACLRAEVRFEVWL